MRNVGYKMEKIKLELYTDYLICNNGFATATGLSAMIDGDISHDQMTRFLSSRPFTSKDLWEQVKPIAEIVNVVVASTVNTYATFLVCISLSLALPSFVLSGLR